MKLWIRRGLTRTVLITKKYAIKVPRWKSMGVNSKNFYNRASIEDRLHWWTRGYQANASEKAWSAADPKALCPVIKSYLFGIINVYPRAQSAEDVVTAGEIPDIYPQPRWRFPGDQKVSNVGVLNGRLVWIDYDMSFNGCVHDKSGVRLNKIST